MENLFRRILFSCLLVFGFIFVGKTGSQFTAEPAYAEWTPEELEELLNDETFLSEEADMTPEEAASMSVIEEESSIEGQQGDAQQADQREPAASDAFSYRISSRKGIRRHPITGRVKYHAGTDYAAPCGTPINSRQGGTITSAGWLGGYGNAVLVNFGRCSALYGHMSRVLVRSGQQVGAGTLLGLVGRTGFATGCHLHYEDCSAKFHGRGMRRAAPRGYPTVEPQYYRRRQWYQQAPPQEYNIFDWFRGSAQ